MTLDFNLGDVASTEFGVGYEAGDGQIYHLVPVDGDVQAALRDMAASTRDAMENLADKPAQYEPSQKYEAKEYLALQLDDDLAPRMRILQEANNLPFDSNALAQPQLIGCYFSRLADSEHRRLTAVRRATQFKGVLKSRLIRLATNALKLIDEQVFKLDNDFDLLIDSRTIHVLRPAGFEFLEKLQNAVLAAVPANARSVQRDLSFVDFGPIETYASNHTRAARYLASIRSSKGAKHISKKALKELCHRTGVEIRDARAKISIEPGSEMGFLEVLDRRRYQIELIEKSPERFRATSREKISGLRRG